MGDETKTVTAMESCDSNLVCRWQLLESAHALCWLIESDDGIFLSRYPCIRSVAFLHSSFTPSTSIHPFADTIASSYAYACLPQLCLWQAQEPSEAL